MHSLQFCTIVVVLLLTTYSAQSLQKDSDISIPQIDNAARDLIAKYNVPQVSLAVTKDGKLVYAKAYGLEETASIKNRFRISSASKPITAIAIMKLVEEGALSLNDKVFGAEGILGTEYQPLNSFTTEITVFQLITHTVGYWTSDGPDPLITHLDVTSDELISWTFENLPLYFSPGEPFVYSNFGYLILGRVIEHITGQSYEDYVQSTILAPIGITDMEIAGRTEADRKPNEVKYFSEDGEYGISVLDPYFFNVTRMDSSGGWIATAIDLVKLLVHVDGFNNPPDILSSETIKTMTTPTSLSSTYAFGWMISEGGTWYHTGFLPGTYSYISRTADGFCWSILTNTYLADPQYATDIERLIWDAIEDPDTMWPERDLF